MSISQFLISGVQVSGVQMSEALDRDPDLAVGVVAVGVAVVGDARSPH